jgi:hypothetical protein
MAKLLSELVDELVEQVPPVDGVPSTEQYRGAVKDAVAEFSRRCGTTKIATLNVVAGTAVYTLPADFLTLISLTSLFAIDGVINTSTGLIPVVDGFDEKFTIRGKTITFTPTPTYSLAREFRYKAGWALSHADDTDYSDDEYADMGEEEAQIVLINAKANAIAKQVNAEAGAGMKYSLGAVSVDNSSGVESKTKMLYILHNEFVKACELYNGSVAMNWGM